MMRVSIFFLLFSFFFPAKAQEMPLSPTATATVLTCGPGNDFYTTFGHSAIRICDTAQGIDFVYNYGTFDFGIPHFYWHFMRGKLDYCLSRSRFLSFLATYDYEQRAVWEQPLNLTPQEVNNLFVMLEWNYLPENRYYRYDFFRDNCATRVRDMVEAACGRKQPVLPPCEPMSYRRYLHQSTAGGRLEWWTMGVDLLLGLPADHRCDAREVMFHPEHMMALYAGATRDDTPLTSGFRQLLPDHRPPLHRSFPPLLVFGLFFVAALVLTLASGRWTLLTNIFDRVLFILAGIIGLMLLFMWFGTDHYCTAWNLHILWASPLLLLIALRMHRSPRWALWFQEACFLAAVVWVAVCGLSLAYIPVILTLALRVAVLLKQNQKP